MKIYLICPVTNASQEAKTFLDAYVANLERQGHEVYYPTRDTDQDENRSGYDICLQNTQAIRDADAVYIYYDPGSKGSHFDMGVAFALDKPITVVAGANIHSDRRTFPGMLHFWQNLTCILNATKPRFVLIDNYRIPEKAWEKMSSYDRGQMIVNADSVGFSQEMTVEEIMRKYPEFDAGVYFPEDKLDPVDDYRAITNDPDSVEDFKIADGKPFEEVSITRFDDDPNTLQMYIRVRVREGVPTAMTAEVDTKPIVDDPEECLP